MGSLSSLVCTGVLRNKMIQYDNMSQYICICIPICFWSEFVLKQSKKVNPPKKHKTSLVRLLGILWIVKRAPKKAWNRFEIPKSWSKTRSDRTALQFFGKRRLLAKGRIWALIERRWKMWRSPCVDSIFVFFGIPTLKDGFVVACRKNIKFYCKNIPQSQWVFLRLLK